jgi:hypothetical protein
VPLNAAGLLTFNNLADRGMSQCQFRLRHLIAMCPTSAKLEAVAVQFSWGGPV